LEIHGQIRNGVVVLDYDPRLPDGTEVTVRLPGVSEMRSGTRGTRVDFPLVHGKIPASVNLTNERIAEILDDDDVSA